MSAVNELYSPTFRIVYFSVSAFYTFQWKKVIVTNYRKCENKKKIHFLWQNRKLRNAFTLFYIYQTVYKENWTTKSKQRRKNSFNNCIHHVCLITGCSFLFSVLLVITKIEKHFFLISTFYSMHSIHCQPLKSCLVYCLSSGLKTINNNSKRPIVNPRDRIS